MRKIVFTALVMVAVYPVSAAAQFIRGTVKDADTDAAINAVSVSLFAITGRKVYTTFSREDGTFVLVVPRGAPVFIQIDRIGYETVVSEALTTTPGEQLEIEVRLSPRAVPIDPVVVVAHTPIDPRLREFQDRVARYKRPGIGRIWTRADLEQRPFGMVSHIVRMVPTRPGMFCAGTAFFVDNVRISIGDDDATLSDLDMVVGPEQLEGLEIYRDTDVPPELYHFSRRIDGSAFCMVVLAWRKPYSELHGPRPPIKQMVLHLGLVAGIILIQQLIAQ